MERKNHRLLAMAIVLGTVLVLSACSDNDNNVTPDSSAANQAGVQLAIQGPLDYDWLLQMEQAKLESPSSVSATSSAAEEGTEVAVKAITGVLQSLDSPMKLVTSGIKLILAPFKIWQDVKQAQEQEQEKTDIETAFNILFEEVDELQTEIADLQNEILTENQILQSYVQQFNKQTECSAYANFENAVQSVYVGNVTAPESMSGCSIENEPSGVVNDVVNCLKTNGYYTPATESTPGSLDLIGAATDGTVMKFINNLVTEYTTTSTSLTYSLNGISGTNLSKGALTKQTTTVDNTCATTGASLADELACWYTFLVESLPEAGTSYTVPHPSGVTEVSNNFVDTLEGYNDFVMFLYQQSVSALSAAMLMEMLTSTLNYINYGNACLGSPQTPTALTKQQIGSWEPYIDTVSVGTDYTLNTESHPICFNQTTCSLDADAAQTSYKEAITGILLLFAARMNALWDTVMVYVISDAPLSIQDPYTAPPTKLVNGQQTTLPSQGSIATPMDAILLSNPAYADESVNPYKVPMSGMKGDGFLYQYGNIMDVYGCLEDLLGNSESTCKAAFPDGSDGIYDGTMIRVYVSNGNSEDPDVLLVGDLDLSCCYVLSKEDTYIFDRQPWCQRPAGTQFVNSTALTSNSTMPGGAFGYIQWALVDSDTGYVQGSCNHENVVGLSPNDCGDAANDDVQYGLDFSLVPTQSEEGSSGVWAGDGCPCGVYNTFATGPYFKVVGAASTDPALFYLNASNIQPPSTNSGLTYTTFGASTSTKGATHPYTSSYIVGFATMESESSGSTWELNMTGFTQNKDDYQHTLLLQLNLPNGYKMPVYYMMYQQGGGDKFEEKDADKWVGNNTLFFCPTTLLGMNSVDPEYGAFGTIEPEDSFFGLKNCAGNRKWRPRN